MGKMRNKISRFNRNTDGSKVVVEDIDLSQEATKREIKDTIALWIAKKDAASLEDGAIIIALERTLENPQELA